jgi:hypothetical protein
LATASTIAAVVRAPAALNPWAAADTVIGPTAAARSSGVQAAVAGTKPPVRFEGGLEGGSVGVADAASGGSPGPGRPSSSGESRASASARSATWRSPLESSRSVEAVPLLRPTTACIVSVC